MGIGSTPTKTKGCSTLRYVCTTWSISICMPIHRARYWTRTSQPLVITWPSIWSRTIAVGKTPQGCLTFSARRLDCQSYLPTLWERSEASNSSKRAQWTPLCYSLRTTMVTWPTATRQIHPEKAVWYLPMEDVRGHPNLRIHPNQLNKISGSMKRRIRPRRSKLRNYWESEYQSMWLIDRLAFSLATTVLNLISGNILKKIVVEAIVCMYVFMYESTV